jgi:hypothetical protein
MDPRGHVAEENVESKVVEERHADREQQEHANSASTTVAT